MASVVDVEYSHAAGHDGFGSPFTLDSMWPLYCATKPLVAAAALALERQAELDLDAPLGRILPWRTSRYVASLTTLDVLEHRTYLPDVPGFVAFMMSDEQRWRTVFRASGAPVLASGSRYNVFCGYFLVGTVIQHVTGLPIGAALRALVTDPLGIDDLGFFDDVSHFEGVMDRVVMPAYRSTLDPDVMLAATGAKVSAVATRPNAAFGAYGSVRALTAFTQHIGREAGGLVSAPLFSERFRQRMNDPFDDACYDDTLQRVAQFRCGFEVDVGAHGFGGSLSARAFGHGSEGGGITIVVDPADGLCVVGTLSVLESELGAMRLRREHLVDEIATHVRRDAAAQR